MLRRTLLYYGIGFFNQIRTFAESFSPLSLPLVQWLKGLVAPSTVDDITPNELGAVMVESPCYTFDGVDTWANFGTSFVPPASGWSASCWSDMTASGIGSIIDKLGTASSGLQEGDGGFIFGLRSGGQLYFSFWQKQLGVTTTSLIVTSEIPTGDLYFAEFGYNGTNGWIRINGGATFSGADVPIVTFSNTRELAYGARVNTGNPGFFPSGRLFGVEFTDDATGDVIWDTPCSENSDLTSYNTIAGENGAITVGAGGQDAFYGQTQDVFHDAAIRGCSKMAVFDGTTSSSTGLGSATAGDVTDRKSVV